MKCELEYNIFFVSLPANRRKMDAVREAALRTAGVKSNIKKRNGKPLL